MWFLSIRVLLLSTDVSPQAELRDEGTLLKPDIRIDTAVRRFTGIGAVAAWAGVASFPYGSVYVPLFSEIPESLFMIPLICFGAAVGFSWLWWRYKRQQGISVLLLTPERLNFPSLAKRHAVSWDDVIDIRNKLNPAEGIFWDPMVLMTNDDSYRWLEASGIYTTQGTALIDLVRFYWEHPERRHELTTGHAITRLQQLQTPEQS
jgi:hypothetical protein